MTRNSMNSDLLKYAASFVSEAAETLCRTLQTAEDGEELGDDDTCPAEAFTELHAAMVVYAQQFDAYEGHAKNGYGTITVTVTEG